MKQSIRTGPPNSLFFIEDPVGGEAPEVDHRPTRIWSSRSCILVGCLNFVDGDTEFVASNSPEDAPSSAPAFSGSLDTPSGSIEISTSEREVLLRIAVATTVTPVRVWTNHPSEPDQILAVFG